LRPVWLSVVHCSRTGQGWQVRREKATTMASVAFAAPRLRWLTVPHEVLVCPWGQVARWLSKSIVNAVLSNPAAARACAELLASSE